MVNWTGNMTEQVGLVDIGHPSNTLPELPL